MTAPGTYRVLDHNGRLTGVVVVELMALPTGWVTPRCRWAGQSRWMTLADLGAVRLEGAMWP